MTEFLNTVYNSIRICGFEETTWSQTFLKGEQTDSQKHMI